MNRLVLILGVLLPTTLAAQIRKSAFFVEGGGSAGYGSVNLELGVSRQIRLRGGGGLLWIWPTVPITGSLLLGHSPNCIEIGGGATLIFTPQEFGDKSGPNEFIENILFAEGQGTLVMVTGILGYRYQPSQGALIRATLTPLHYSGKTVVWFGLSLGFSF